MCQGGPRSTRNDRSQSRNNKQVNEVKEDKKKEEETADLGTLTGSWFLLNTMQQYPTLQDGLYEVKDELISELRYSKQAHVGAIKGYPNTHKICHHILDQFGNWTPGNVLPHSKVDIHIQLSKSAAKQFQLPMTAETRSTRVTPLVDTGAQMCVTDWQVAKRMGLTKSDLITPALSVSVADNSNLELIGA